MTVPQLAHSPWNYPVVLSLGPLVGAIAAGCPAVIKPSEVSANVSDLLAELLPKYLDPNAYAVVKGAVPETTYLLSLKWDFILYTGSGVVGKIVATAAAKNITPCALELGGMSPVVVADDADINLAAKRILWGWVSLTNL
jgi:aldehyde dehydrogenase (NAD+)